MGSQKSTTTTKVPKEIRERGSQITNGAMGSYFDPGQRYTAFQQGATPSGSDAGTYDWTGVGQATTGQLNGYHTMAGQGVTNAQGNYQPYFNTATNLAGQAQGFQANASTADPNVNTNAASGSINPQTGQAYYGAGNNQAGTVDGPNFSSDALQRFMNPYQQNVIDQGVRQIGDAMTQQRLADQSRAGLAGAFGGTRHAVLDSLNANNAMTTLSDFVGSQLASGYNNAVNQFNTNFNQGLQAQTLNNAAAGQNFGQGLQQAGFNNNLGQQTYQNQMEQLAQGNQAAQQNYQNYLQALGINNAAAGQNFGQAMQGANFLQGMGTAQQDATLRGAEAATNLGNIYTAQDEAQKQNAYNYGYLDARNYPLEVYERLAGINAMQPVNRTSTTSSSGGWLGPALGAAGSIMASDERAKEDIRDRDPEEVLGAFAKVRPKTYSYTDEARAALPETTADGERRGFLAQDYETAFQRKNPEVGGYQHIDIPNVLGDLVAAVHGLEKRTRKLKRV